MRALCCLLFVLSGTEVMVGIGNHLFTGDLWVQTRGRGVGMTRECYRQVSSIML